jgi:hypothetical protein
MPTRLLAFICRICPVCVAARRWPGSWVARFVRWYSPACPFCRAYRTLHAPAPHTPAEPPVSV